MAATTKSSTLGVMAPHEEKPLPEDYKTAYQLLKEAADQMGYWERRVRIIGDHVASILNKERRLQVKEVAQEGSDGEQA